VNQRLGAIGPPAPGNKAGHASAKGACFIVGRPADGAIGEGMGAYHCPVDVVSHVFEEGSAVAFLQSLEDFVNTGRCK
jgi:hypothetical protein